MSLASTSSGIRRVLVADDVPFNRMLLRAMLELEKCQVIEAEDGIAAMQVLSTTTIDLVFLDLRMPGADGMQVLQQYRAWPASTAQVYIVSTDISDDQRSALLAAGAQGILERPIAPDAVRTLVRAP